MAKYGTRKYSSGFRYGEPSTVGVYYDAHLTARAKDYGTVELTWKTILVDPADFAPTHWRLIKSYLGSLDNPDDGQILASGAYSAITSSYVDSPLIFKPQEVNYSLWIFNGVKWIQCGSANELLVANSESLATVTRWVPKAWLNPTISYIGDGVGEDENNTLYKVLGAYAFTYDKLRSQATLLGLSSDPVYTPSSLLRYGVTDQGHTYEPSLGDSYHRSLYGAGNIINSYKATSLGIGVYTTALTHWANDVTIGHNLLLDYNDSSFEESLGRWTASSGTLIQKTYASDTVIAPSKNQVLFDPIFKPRTVGFAQLTTTATTAVSLTMTGDATQYGVSVKGNTRYIFSGQVLHRDNAANVTTTIEWFNMFGVSLGSTTAATAVTTATTWKEFKTISDSGRNGSLSPVTAAYAKPTITIVPSSASSSRYVLDFLQFAKADKSLEYQDAKLIVVPVVGEKQNYLPNSSFEDGLYCWATNNATAVLDNTSVVAATVTAASASGIRVTYTASNIFEVGISVSVTGLSTSAFNITGVVETASSSQFTILSTVTGTAVTGATATATGTWSKTAYGVHGTKAVKITASAANAALVSDWVSLDPGSTVTFSVYVLGTTTDTAIARIEFSSLSSESEQTTILSDAEGLYYPTTVWAVESDPVTLSTTEKKQISVTTIVPPYSKDAGYPLAKVTIRFPNSINTRVYYIDGAMLEPKSSPSRFFSGTGGIASTDPSTQQVYLVDNTKWETKNVYNYISNPDFKVDTSDWTPTAGTTLTRTNSDNGYTTGYTGSYWGKVAFGTTQTVSASMTHFTNTDGGEDITVSAYVRGPAGTYTVIGPNSSKTFVVSNADASSWTRIWLTDRALAGAGTSTFSFGSNNGTYFHIDAVQAEYGRFPSKYVGPEDAATTTLASPLYSAMSMHTAQIESTNSGKSNFLNNYPVKISRLKNTLSQYVPNGSSFAIKTGSQDYGYRELDKSLIPNASFETSLGSWVVSNSTLSRVISRGSEFSELVTHGQAYCKVTTAGSSGSVPFGIKTSNVAITDDGGYYASVALRPGAANAAGTYALKVDFYNASATLVYTKTTTKTFTTTTRWAYLADTYSVANIGGSTYAVLTVTATPSGGYVSGQNFHIDRVVFRQ